MKKHAIEGYLAVSLNFVVEEIGKSGEALVRITSVEDADDEWMTGRKITTPCCQALAVVAASKKKAKLPFEYRAGGEMCQLEKADKMHGLAIADKKKGIIFLQLVVQGSQLEHFLGQTSSSQPLPEKGAGKKGFKPHNDPVVESFDSRPDLREAELVLRQATAA